MMPSGDTWDASKPTLGNTEINSRAKRLSDQVADFLIKRDFLGKTPLFGDYPQKSLNPMRAKNPSGNSVLVAPLVTESDLPS